MAERLGNIGERMGKVIKGAGETALYAALTATLPVVTGYLALTGKLDKLRGTRTMPKPSAPLVTFLDEWSQQPKDPGVPARHIEEGYLGELLLNAHK